MTFDKPTRRPRSVESLFPSPAGRAAADAAIDVLDTLLPMTTYLDVWEETYFAKVGKSPFRK